MPPVKPMLARAVKGIPRGDLAFEPKWDGFRCIVFRDGGELEIASRNCRPLVRYFPELIEPLRVSLPERVVVDGEIIVRVDDRLGFDALQQRIHPAASRVKLLSEQTPAEVVLFDVLAAGSDNLMGQTFRRRRSTLCQIAAAFKPPVHLAPSTTERSVAVRWHARFEGAGLDGLIAKPRGGLYEPNKRSQIKVKHTRTLDVVVAGYRVHRDGRGVGSLVVGLYGDDGRLHHCGVAASFAARRRAELVAELAPYVLHTPRERSGHPWAQWMDPAAHESGPQMPGAPNRWSAQRGTGQWVPLRIQLVAEVKYTAMLNGRFRGTTRWVRWRHDRTPDSCDYGQVEVPAPVAISEVLSATA